MDTYLCSCLMSWFRASWSGVCSTSRPKRIVDRKDMKRNWLQVILNFQDISHQPNKTVLTWEFSINKYSGKKQDMSLASTFCIYWQGQQKLLFQNKYMVTVSILVGAGEEHGDDKKCQDICYTNKNKKQVRKRKLEFTKDFFLYLPVLIKNSSMVSLVTIPIW